ncbi:ribulose-phosphate 3-epimerase [Candidatus Sumerlaeota bacterium]|nr:ribulose-phosphate 3-epimerase [Candidatus Sumerlaeota bacterium]
MFKNGPRSEVVIAPSILSADFANLGRELALCRRNKARWIHIDVMDGHFVPNLTLGPPLVKSCRAAEPNLFFDTHLMLDQPMDFAEPFKEAGSELITIHAEASKNPRRDLRSLRSMGLKAGISIKPGTSIQALKDCLEEADLILIMTVEPGFGGQALIPKTLNKVRELDLLRQKHGFKFRLQVDGGINKTTAPLAVAAGADVLVAGSAVFNGGKIAENLAALREAIVANGSTRSSRSSKKSR